MTTRHGHSTHRHLWKEVAQAHFGLEALVLVMEVVLFHVSAVVENGELLLLRVVLDDALLERGPAQVGMLASCHDLVLSSRLPHREADGVAVNIVSSVAQTATFVTREAGSANCLSKRSRCDLRADLSAMVFGHQAGDCWSSVWCCSASWTNTGGLSSSSFPAPALDGAARFAARAARARSCASLAC